MKYAVELFLATNFAPYTYGGSANCVWIPIGRSRCLRMGIPASVTIGIDSVARPEPGNFG